LQHVPSAPLCLNHLAIHKTEADHDNTRKLKVEYVLGHVLSHELAAKRDASKGCGLRKV